VQLARYSAFGLPPSSFIVSNLLGKNSHHPREQFRSYSRVFLEKTDAHLAGNGKKPQIRRENVLEQFREIEKRRENRTYRRL
jgi:hypothetical protein